MDYCEDFIHLVYLMKQLHDLNKLSLVASLTDWPIITDGELDYDLCCEASNLVMDGTFEHSAYYCNEDKEYSTQVTTGEVMRDYYLLADEYGKRNGLTEKNNPFIEMADGEAKRRFSFSYDLEAFLQHRPKSKSRYKTKLVLLWNDYGDIDYLGVAIGIAGLYGFFKEKNAELKALLAEKEADAA